MFDRKVLLCSLIRPNKIILCFCVLFQFYFYFYFYLVVGTNTINGLERIVYERRNNILHYIYRYW